MPKKGRARRFREAREMKQGFDDGLFKEGSGSLADVESDSEHDSFDAWDDEPTSKDWDDDDPLKQDDRNAS
ncbi:MAG: hypothetical protein ACOYN3_06165 [Acidimicrobiia bacterium]